MGTFFIVWGVLEGGALALAIAGHVEHAEAKRLVGGLALPGAQVHVGPLVTPNGRGLALRGTF
jgi:hypothetical protein